jgi:hypothetical protein
MTDVDVSADGLFSGSPPAAGYALAAIGALRATWQ